MRRYKVTGQAFNRITGMPMGKTRTEVIDVSKNVLFKGANSVIDVKKAYESFWNELNPRSKEVVFVKRIKIL